MAKTIGKLVIQTPQGAFFKYDNGKGGKVSSRLVWSRSFSRERTQMFNKGQMKLDSEIMRLMEPYMQLQSAAMIKSMRLSSTPGTGEVVVNTPYARKVYYSRSAIGRPTGALRGPRYFERMKADKKRQLRRIIANEMGAK